MELKKLPHSFKTGGKLASKTWDSVKRSRRDSEKIAPCVCVVTRLGSE